MKGYGSVVQLPQAKEFEKAILSAMLNDSECVEEIFKYLTPQEFYSTDHQNIAQAALSLISDKKSVSLSIVLAKLKETGKAKNGIAGYLSKLSDYPASAGIAGDCKEIKDAAARRRTWEEGQRISKAALESGNLQNCVDDAIANISAALDYRTKKATLEDVILDIGQFHRMEISRRRLYLDPWLKEDAIILCSGWTGTGKTWFAMSVLDAVSRGDKFGPWECQKAVPCLFLDGEMPAADVQERSEILQLNADRKQPLFIYCDAHANSLGLPKANLNSDTWRHGIKRILTTRGIKLWVIDNLASVAAGLDENSRQDWDPINQWLLELRFAGITTIMLHHTGKGGAQRGTSAREDNLDCSIILKSPPGSTPDDGARFICHFTKARVGSSDLRLIQDMEFKLIQDESGRHVWTFGGVRQEMRKQILTLLGEGMKQVDVAQHLGINKGQVSKVRSRAIKDGWLTEKNKLTQSGFLEVSIGK